MKVIGYKQSNFRAKDGPAVEGYNIYCTYPLNSPIADGEACERLFITDKKLNDCGYIPGAVKSYAQILLQALAE